MVDDKTKQYIGMFGGVLSAILLFLGTLNIKFEWYTAESISAFMAVIMAAAPLVLALYGVYKNSYLLSKKAKKQEEVLKENGLK